MLTKEQFQELRNQGLSVNQIISFENKAKEERANKIQKITKETDIAKSEAEKAGSPLGIAKETLFETGRQLTRGAAGFGVSAFKAPSDIYRGIQGEKPSEEKTKLPFFEPIETIQSKASRGFLAANTGLEKAKVYVDAITETASGAAEILGLMQGAKKMIDKSSDVLKRYSSAKNVERSIEAVSPTLKGKKLREAYRKQAFTEKGIKDYSPEALQDIKDIKLGQDLSDVIKSTDPRKNLNSLGKDFFKTEGKLNKLLSEDKTVIDQTYQTYFKDSIDNLKNQIPREFKIKPLEKGVFDDVLDFAKELYDDTEKTMEGFREGRKLFDRAAKQQYPTVFKNGYTDTTTSAGKAIKMMRDLWGDSLYEIAEEGSEVQKLIGRESSLYTAVDNVSEKASKLMGKNTFSRFIKKHPVWGHALEALGAGTAGGIIVNKLSK